jgi:hypothetical protein
MGTHTISPRRYGQAELHRRSSTRATKPALTGLAWMESSFSPRVLLLGAIVPQGRVDVKSYGGFFGGGADEPRERQAKGITTREMPPAGPSWRPTRATRGASPKHLPIGAPRTPRVYGPRRALGKDAEQAQCRVPASRVPVFCLLQNTANSRKTTTATTAAVDLWILARRTVFSAGTENTGTRGVQIHRSDPGLNCSAKSLNLVMSTSTR